MTLDYTTWMQAVLALAAVLLLLWLAARGLRASGVATRAGRRLAVQEVLAIDSRRRLLLVRCDGRDLLLLTGGAQDAVVGWLPPGEAAKPAPGDAA
jgi:flagellar protein FliO/FliZ